MKMQTATYGSVPADAGVVAYKEGSATVYNMATGLPTNDIAALTGGHEGNLWIGTREHGLITFKDGKFTGYTTEDGLADNNIQTLFIDVVNSVWIGTENNGVSRYRNGTFSTFSTSEGLTYNGVKALCGDHEGSLWIGTDGGGLNRLGNGKFTTFTQKEGVGDAQAQRAGAVQILEVYGQRELQAGVSENYRVRVSSTSFWPIKYLWRLEDGWQTSGNSITLRFETPGTYLLIVSASNEKGVDQDTIAVRVTPGSGPVKQTHAEEEPALPLPNAGTSLPRPAKSKVEIYGGGSVEPDQGGYTWIVATHLSRHPADVMVQQYHHEGYRTSLFIDRSGKGSTAYRVMIGQFSSHEAAARARNLLPMETQEQAWLMKISALNIER